MILNPLIVDQTMTEIVILSTSEELRKNLSNSFSNFERYLRYIK